MSETFQNEVQVLTGPQKIVVDPAGFVTLVNAGPVGPPGIGGGAIISPESFSEFMDVYYSTHPNNSVFPVSDFVSLDLIASVVRNGDMALIQHDENNNGSPSFYYYSSTTSSWVPWILLESGGSSSTTALNEHITSLTPHSAYDDIQSLTTLFENGLA